MKFVGVSHYFIELIMGFKEAWNDNVVYKQQILNEIIQNKCKNTIVLIDLRLIQYFQCWTYIALLESSLVSQSPIFITEYSSFYYFKMQLLFAFNY